MLVQQIILIKYFNPVLMILHSVKEVIVTINPLSLKFKVLKIDDFKRV